MPIVRLLKKITHGTYVDAKRMILGFRADPLYCITYYIITAAMTMLFVIFGYSFITFIVDGGYASHIGNIRDDGIFGAFRHFTGGTAGNFYSGLAGYVYLLLFIALICMFVSENIYRLRLRKISFTIISGFVFLFIILIPGIIALMVTGILPPPQRYMNELTQYVPEDMINNQWYGIVWLGAIFDGVVLNTRVILVVVIIYIAATLGVIISSLIMMYKGGQRFPFSRLMYTVLTGIIILPLALWLIENILIIGTALVAIAIVLAGIWLLIKILGSGGEGAGTGSSAGTESSAGGICNSTVNNKQSHSSNAYKHYSLQVGRGFKNVFAFDTFDGTQIVVLEGNDRHFEKDTPMGSKGIYVAKGDDERFLCYKSDLNYKTIIEYGKLHEIMEKYQSMGK